MERKFEEVGHRVEPQPSSGQFSDITHTSTASGEARRVGSADATSSDSLQAAVKKTATVVGDGIRDRRDDVIAYVRREPVAALTTATALGFLVGLSVAIGSRADTGGGTRGLLRRPRRSG